MVNMAHQNLDPRTWVLRDLGTGTGPGDWDSVTEELAASIFKEGGFGYGKKCDDCNFPVLLQLNGEGAQYNCLQWCKEMTGQM